MSVFAVMLILCSASLVSANDDGPENLISANLLGPLLGYYGGTYERAIDDGISAFVSPNYFNWQLGLQGLITPAEFTFWQLLVDAGANHYLEGTLEELYIGGAGIVGYATVGWEDPEETRVSENATRFGVQAHVGYRLIFDWISVAPQAGVRYELSLIDLEVAIGDQTVRERLAAQDGLSFPVGVLVSIAF